jgi:hypothetical protein
MRIFAKEVEKINELNQEARLKNESLRLTINKFSDLEHEEFISSHTGYLISSEPTKNKNTVLAYSLSAPDWFGKFRRKFFLISLSSHYLPWHLDWRKHNAVTSVKDQSDCG